MIFFSKQHCCWLAIALLHYVNATSQLLETLSNTPELSLVSGYIKSLNLTSYYVAVENFTFLAPSNDAITAYAQTYGTAVPMKDAIMALLQYSLLQGIYPSLSFTEKPQFVQSYLVNTSYANVTGGQRVELSLSSAGSPQVITGNKTISVSSATDILCIGGIIHILDKVFTVPVAAVIEISQIPLEYLISILNNGGYLSVAYVGYVSDVLTKRDVTYFIPNTPSALANFTSLAKTANASELQAVFQYHFVPGKTAYSTDLTDGMVLKTAQGSDIIVTLQGEDIYVNAAKVIASDYLVANGVVHVIDNFLDRFNTSGPPAPTVSTTPTKPSPTAAVSSTSSALSDFPKTKSSLGTTIGIAVGASLVGIAIIAASIWFIMRRRGQKKINTGVWDASISNAGKFYVTRGGQVRRQEEMGLGLQSTGMHEVGSIKSYGDTNSSRPQS